MDWKLIDTALRDDVPVFLLSRAYTETDEFSDEKIHHTAKCAIGVWWPEGDSWTDEYGNADGDICQLTVTGVWESGGGWFEPNEVTHWMPLPAPPV